MTMHRRSLLGAALLTLAFVVWGVLAILGSTSSTAVIGFVFLPFYAAGVAVGGYLAVRSVLVLWAGVFEPSSRSPLRHTSWAAIFLASLFSAVGYGAWRHAHLEAAASPQTGAAQLVVLLDDGLASRDRDLLARLARNPALAPDRLERIAAHCEPMTRGTPAHDACYRVVYALAGNPRLPADWLRRYSGRSEASIRIAVSRNPATPRDVVELLAGDPRELVRIHAKRALARKPR